MIGMNLKYLRKKYGYSQEDLAERLEVSRQSVAKGENEESLPDVEKCVTMAQIFETTARNEKAHAQQWYEYLHGGQMADTKENLKLAASGEHYEWSDMYPSFAKTAKEELRQATDFWFSVMRKKV